MAANACRCTQGHTQTRKHAELDTNRHACTKAVTRTCTTTHAHTQPHNTHTSILDG
ncbi:hypothetical protein J4Q44_G00080900 [Coregonus suidteri]|uniref:Uncharacterized protein n=1 Tax=Coregonus suidteri TaxID=861788 RepID=A0AAN8M3D3_9TELE